jgi:hypothetical protein
MSNNQTLLAALKNYLRINRGKEKATNPERFSVWYDQAHELEIVLPAEALANHEQSNTLLSEAIIKISNAYGLCPANFKTKLLNGDSDFLQVRSSGERINHGRINFSEGLNALTGLYGIIKSSASNNIKVKGKRKAINQYLSGVNMLAPKAGSFIYTVELQLLDLEEVDSQNKAFEQETSFGRYVNANLAIALARVAEKIKSKDYESPAKLLSVGIDSTFCNNFLNLFSSSSDKLEFNFDWSFKEELFQNVPNMVIFNYSDRERIERFKKLLSKSSTKQYVDLPAYIEKYSWPIEDEKGRVYLRLVIDGKDHTCFIETDSSLYETLKAEHAKKQISITCELLITSGNRTSIDVLKLHSIRINENQEIKVDV